MVHVNVRGSNGRVFDQGVDLLTTDTFTTISNKLEDMYAINNISSFSLEGGSLMDRLSTTTAVQTWPTMNDNQTLVLISAGQDGVRIGVRSHDGSNLGEIDIINEDKFNDILSKIGRLNGAPISITSISVDGGSVMDSLSTTNAIQTWPTMSNGDKLMIATKGSDGF